MACAFDRLGRFTQREVAVGEHIGGSAIAPAHHCAHACEQFTHVKGLHEIVIRTGVQTVQSVFERIAGCEDDDGNVVFC